MLPGEIFGRMAFGPMTNESARRVIDTSGCLRLISTVARVDALVEDALHIGCASPARYLFRACSLLDSLLQRRSARPTAMDEDLAGLEVCTPDLPCLIVLIVYRGNSAHLWTLHSSFLSIQTTRANPTALNKHVLSSRISKKLLPSSSSPTLILLDAALKPASPARPPNRATKTLATAKLRPRRTPRA